MMMRQLRMWTLKWALAVLGLLRLWIVWYISAIPTWRKVIDNLLSNIQSTLRFIYGYLLTFSTSRLSLNFIPLNYQLVLRRSQRGYFFFKVQSCTFIIQFYTTDISITSLYLVILSTLVKASRWSGRERDNTFESKESLRISPIARWFRGYFC